MDARGDNPTIIGSQFTATEVARAKHWVSYHDVCAIEIDPSVDKDEKTKGRYE
jgi:hypothetical protein